MTPQILASIFLAAVFLSAMTKVALMLRQMRHVRLHGDQVPAPFAASISIEAHRKAAEYTRARMQLGIVDVLLNATFVLLMTLGGGLAALHDMLAHWLPTDGLTHGVALLAALGIAGWLIEMPITLLRIFAVEKRFGFNRMTPALFIADLLRSAAITTAIGLPLLFAVLWLMEAMGERWWLWVWLFWLAFNLLGLLIWPTWIAPLFNKFTPLADQDLKARVEKLLQRCGFQAQGLYVMDGSRRSAHGNAYFTGFGASRRIVFFDTLLDKLAPQEIEAVLAHELGHFHHRHIWKRIAVTSAMTLGTLWLLAWLMTQQWFFSGLGMHTESTAAALALLSLALPAFAFPIGPLMSHWSRKNEFEADRYAAQHTQAEDLVSALLKLYRDNASTLTPDPLYSRVFDSHPPAAARIAQLRTPR
ncbi:MAG: M48 family metallopeptidase [Rhodocyclales bacterium]|nr:M48 family metallopeptidase [Rhodocyclales bacterium]